jgi:hypothetical protein
LWKRKALARGFVDRRIIIEEVVRGKPSDPERVVSYRVNAYEYGILGGGDIEASKEVASANELLELLRNKLKKSLAR